VIGATVLGMASRRPGRPTIDPTGHEAVRVVGYVSPVEEAAVVALAEDRGLSVSAWLRQLVLDAIDSEAVAVAS
jgi:hypothetical protein